MMLPSEVTERLRSVIHSAWDLTRTAPGRVRRSLELCAARLAQIPRFAWILLLLLLLVSPWIISATAPTFTLTTYFWLEGKLPGGDRHERVVPVLYRIGFLRPARVEVEPGITYLLDPRDLIAQAILRGGAWQVEVWDSVAPELAEGSVFLDVGAHIGYFSMKAAVKVGKTGRVVSFEPNPETLKLLRDNVAANRAWNVVVEPIACADRDQILTLYAAPSMNTGASSIARQNADLTSEEPARPYPVRGRPIDDVVRELGLSRVDAIKIDVEGAEVLVLRGALNTLKRFHPKIVVEVVAQQLASLHTTPEELIAVLKEAGYNHSKRVDQTDWEWTVR